MRIETERGFEPEGDTLKEGTETVVAHNNSILTLPEGDTLKEGTETSRGIVGAAISAGRRYLEGRY